MIRKPLKTQGFMGLTFWTKQKTKVLNLNLDTIFSPEVFSNSKVKFKKLRIWAETKGNKWDSGRRLRRFQTLRRQKWEFRAVGWKKFCEHSWLLLSTLLATFFKWGRIIHRQDFHCGLAGKESICNAGDPWVEKIPWRREKSPGEGKGYIRQIVNTHWIIEKAREFQKNVYLCLIDYAKALDCIDHYKLWKILKEMGIPDHLTHLLRNLYAGQEATVRTGHGTTDWFQIGKGIHQSCILSPCLFNLYAEYIMRNAGVGEA